MRRKKLHAVCDHVHADSPAVGQLSRPNCTCYVDFSSCYSPAGDEMHHQLWNQDDIKDPAFCNRLFPGGSLCLPMTAESVCCTGALSLLAMVTVSPPPSGSGTRAKSPGGPRTKRNRPSMHRVRWVSLKPKLTLAAFRQMDCNTVAQADTATTTSW